MAALFLCASPLAAGCSVGDPSTPDTTAGTGGAASAGAPTGGTAAVAGSSAGTGVSAGTGAGGQAGHAGTSGLAGSMTGGTGGMAGGAGGMSGGSAGAGGSGGGKPPPAPSSGCNKTAPATGSSGSPLTVSGHQYYVKLPTNYDASKPYPAMIMMNPTNNPITWAEQNAGFEATGPKEAWIRVYPTMANNASGWGSGDVSFFQPFYDQITSSYCIDKARIFAGGESSGGDMAGILGCEYGDKLAAVVPCSTKPVGGYALDVPTNRKCKGETTAMVMQGKNDNVVGPENGPKMRDFYASLNHCGKTTTPVAGYTDTLSNCVMFEGCDAGHPVYWCNHTDPNYSNTNHGWPTFAPKFIFGLLSAY